MDGSNTEHGVRLTETRFETALREMVEDKIAEVIRHHKKPGVKGGKSNITITIEVIPDDRGEEYHYGLGCSTKLSPTPGYKGTFYGKLNREGQPEIVEFDPNQPGLF